MNYSEKEMAALINEVETQFADHLKKAEVEVETNLTKSEDTNVEVKADTNVVDDANKASLEKSETAQEFDYNDDDYVEMDKMYASMSKSEKDAHYESIKKSIGVSEEPIQSDMKKSEQENDLMKSENEGLKTENDDLKKSLSKLTVAMTDFLKGGKKAPQRKAVTHIEHIAKSEDEAKPEVPAEDVSKLTKKEISTRLSAKIRNGLEKSEREKINQYYEGDIKFDSIKHLL